MEFPEQLAPYRSAILASATPTLLLHAESGPTNPMESKLGGRPYFPHDAHPHIPLPIPKWNMRYTPWPKDPLDGQELQLLIQINFADTPKLDLFPTDGILQIFVNHNDWHDLNHNLVVLYHPADSLPPFNFDDVALDEFRIEEKKLTFSSDLDPISFSDRRFEDIYSELTDSGVPLHEVLSRKFRKEYLDLVRLRHFHDQTSGFGMCKLGGYHHSQNEIDPRTDNNSMLLLQLCDYDDLSWGDCGAGQFFIPKTDLIQKNFSNVFFHWDST